MFKWIIFFLTLPLFASTKILVVGDSQIGATWSKSYVGNFLAECLPQPFVVYGRGGTTLESWLGKGNLHHIETVKRTEKNRHQILGKSADLPLHQKNLKEMIRFYRPEKLFVSFGGNSIGQSEAQIQQMIKRFETVLGEEKMARHQCFFMTPSFEMAVKDRRNIPARTKESARRVIDIINRHASPFCQVIDGQALMMDSPLLTPNFILERKLIPGRPGCGGAAQNDNVHLCGEAAQEIALKLCQQT